MRIKLKGPCPDYLMSKNILEKINNTYNSYQYNYSNFDTGAVGLESGYMVKDRGK
mgnify:CR=1 FL=1